MKTITILISLAVAALLVGATSTMAATTEALWDMEMDEGVQSVAGEWVEQLDDDSGNGEHLFKASFRRPAYSSDVSPLAPGSTVSTVYDSPLATGGTTSYDAVFREATGEAPPLYFGANASFTVESWVKFASGNAATETRYIESWHGSGTYWQMRADKSGGLWYPMFRVNSPYIDSSVGLTEDTWYHVAGVRDSAANEINIYVDGELRGTAAADSGNGGDLGTGAFEAVNDFLYLGRENTGVDSLDFHGYLDMVRISSGVVAPEDFLIVPTITILSEAAPSFAFTGTPDQSFTSLGDGEFLEMVMNQTVLDDVSGHEGSYTVVLTDGAGNDYGWTMDLLAPGNGPANRTDELFTAIGGGAAGFGADTAIDLFEETPSIDLLGVSYDFRVRIDGSDTAGADAIRWDYRETGAFNWLNIASSTGDFAPASAVDEVTINGTNFGGGAGQIGDLVVTTNVPEPSSCLLLVLGTMALALIRRKR